MSSAVLYLPLQHKWFDMILFGEKREEYREFKPYWMTRIKNWWRRSEDLFATHSVAGHGREISISKREQLPAPQAICFINGYQKDARRFIALCDGYEVRRGSVHPEWGEDGFAEKPHFVLKINKVMR